MVISVYQAIYYMLLQRTKNNGRICPHQVNFNSIQESHFIRIFSLHCFNLIFEILIRAGLALI
jgi:hypothetical protein